jgi:ribosomal protein L16 Arg81 hydroxylase
LGSGEKRHTKQTTNEANDTQSKHHTSQTHHKYVAHTSHRDGLDLAKFPNSTDLVAYEVTLKAGEALYIPPYWWHYISTGEDSAAMSVSVVSPSWEEAWLAKAMHHPMPLGMLQDSKVGRKLGIQAVLVQVISR